MTVHPFLSGFLNLQVEGLEQWFSKGHVVTLKCMQCTSQRYALRSLNLPLESILTNHR